jgi:hypothetical protein
MELMPLPKMTGIPDLAYTALCSHTILGKKFPKSASGSQNLITSDQTRRTLAAW